MEDKIKLEGVMSKGYGSIPKLVMLDRELSIEAKAIYAYLASFTGNGDSAFPSISKICFDLQINEKRFNRHKKALFDKGYIEVTQERKGGGKFASNVYTIKHFILPTTQNGGTDSNEPSTHNGSTGNGSTQNGNSENGGTNNNSFTNNSSINNSSIKQQQQPASENQSNFITAWKENGFDDINQGNIKTLEEWIAKFDGNDSVVIKAIKVANELGEEKRNINYLKTILNDWKNRGFKVGEDFDAAEEKRKSEKQKKKSAPRKNFNNSAIRKETIPESILNPDVRETPMSEEDKQHFMNRLKRFDNYRSPIESNG